MQCLQVIPREWVLQGIFGLSPGVALLICRDIFPERFLEHPTSR
ncbi:hypothetical protein ASZ90_014585 [hydrocarbon metagenome]|uniref:Uncharacterized protein n=1 Tax=hydrocarbon metagenome TaxID=938273 RepID=A0A0W8F4G5_9ZZZZ